MMPKRIEILYSLFFLITISCGKIIMSGPSAEKLLNNRHFSWETDTTKHFVIYYEPGSYASRRVKSIEMSSERSFEKTLSILDEKTFDQRIHSFVVASRSRMKDLIGRETNATAFPGSDVICSVYSERIDAFTTHEIMHIISIGLWGETKRWLKEGMAVYSDSTWLGEDLYTVCKRLGSEGKLVPLDKLIHEFVSIPSDISYPEAGSFTRYIYEGGGVQAVKEIWEKGIDHYCSVEGKNLSELEEEWKSMLRR